jgi:CheY-like chemotaxis protein
MTQADRSNPSAQPQPPCLRLALDIMLNCPVAMALAWGPEQTLFYNQAYAALTGVRRESVPGGSVPSLRPPMFGWNPAALQAAWDGASLAFPAQALPLLRNGAREQLLLDLHYTPIRDDSGAVRGVLCAMQAARNSASPASAKGMRILVVEDNADANYLVCEMLQTMGYTVDAAASGEQALAVLAGARPDILFTDVSLPGMSGVDLARLALKTHPDLRIVFATGYNNTLTSQLEFPAVAIQKPYDLETLQQALAGIAPAAPTVRLQTH